MALKAFGPGILFAGAAIGVSHLVQSTRAGALYGLGLLPVTFIALAIKYPAFQFGPRYAAATGTSLLEGYRRQGRWALVLYAVATIGTMWTVQAAVTLVTSGLLLTMLGPILPVTIMSVALLLVCALVTLLGGFGLLDKLVKAAVLLLTLATAVATSLVLPNVAWGSAGSLFALDAKQFFASLPFIVALAGWMPSAIDISVWHSLWTLARRQETGHIPTPGEAVTDFSIGYWGTAFLAICFTLLGAALLFGAGREIPNGATAFAAMVIGLYTDSLGTWSYWLIGGAAFLVMFSTTLTVLDGFPRALSCLVRRFQCDEPLGGDSNSSTSVLYISCLGGLAGGAVLVIGMFRGQLRELVDMATTLSFITAPVMAFLNHRAVTGPEVPPQLRPGRWLTGFSLFSIALLTIFAGVYLWVEFFN